MFCNNCGHRNPLEANFCSSCGSVLTASPNETTVTFIPTETLGESGEEELSINLTEVPSGSGALIVKRGPNAGTKFVLDSAVTSIGRHPDSDIFLDDITVSRRHAEIRHEEGSYRVRDVGSLNGTYLNRERIEEVTLSSGDVLQIGKFKLVYLSAPEE
ncbi:MAG: FHA domain-containing protein [Acidimicrobiales bacterium]